MKLFKLLALCTALSFTQLSFAAGATKVGVIDVQAVVLLSEAGKAGMAELEKNADYTALKAKLDNMTAELKTLREKAETDGLTWGEDQKKEHSKKVSELVQEQQTAVGHLNRGRESVFMQLLQVMEPGIGMATESVMKSEGIELVMDSKAVVLKIPTADISEMVVAKLNELNKQAAAAAKANSSKKAAE